MGSYPNQMKLVPVLFRGCVSVQRISIELPLLQGLAFVIQLVLGRQLQHDEGAFLNLSLYLDDRLEHIADVQVLLPEHGANTDALKV